MIIPIRTDRRLDRTPWINAALIAANVAIFAVTGSRLEDPRVAQWMLTPFAPQLKQFIGYQFLHADVMHLAMNMLFLYIFGNAVEDRLGKIGYLLFYLGGGVCAGLGHAMIEDSPVLGASGSVAAVSGAFLALMPKSQITIFYWFIFFIGMVEVSAMVVIGVYVVIDLFRLAGGGGGVAYLAHLSGYLYGFVIAMGLLAVGLLPRERFDMLSMWKHRRRRDQFRSLTREGYQPWAHGAPAQPPADDADGEDVLAPDPALVEARRAVIAAHGNHDLPAAAAAHQRLIEQFPQQVLPQQVQLDVANQYMAENRHADAARAYEQYLDVYRADSRRAEVELILALLCVRYLDRRQRGRELLTAARPRLHDANHKQLANQLLTEIESASP